MFVLKKKIQELKIASIILVGGVISFIILMIIQKIDGIEDEYKDFDHDQEGRSGFWIPHPEHSEFWGSIGAAFVAFSYQPAFFPIFKSLKEKNKKNGMKFVVGGMSFCCSVYVCVGLIGIFTFGYKLIEHGNVIDLYSFMPTWESYTMRFILLVLFVTHTPFIFFIGKEAMLTIIAQTFYVKNDEEPVYHKGSEMNEIKNSFDS